MSSSQNVIPSRLDSLQDCLRTVFSSRVGSQTRFAVSRMAAQLSGLSRLGKVSVGISSGLLLYWLYLSYNNSSRASKAVSRGPARKKRVRQSSSSTWQLTSETSSVMSRPTYNWAELQKHSVSDQDSVVSAATLVDGTQLAPQQLGL